MGRLRLPLNVVINVELIVELIRHHRLPLIVESIVAAVTQVTQATLVEIIVEGKRVALS